ncbi:MAG: N-acyl-D-amino-acid deacylase family protein, partial [Clostridia bacterium]
MDFDILIKGGLVVDGSGEPAFSADVGIRNDKIAAVGRLEDCEAETVIDANGLTVTPGLIDAHTHADKTLMIYPGAENYRTQGITTVVGGNCGSGPAPLTKYYLQGYWDWDWWYDVNPRIYYEEVVADLEPAADAMREHHGIELDWRSFGEFFEKLRARRPGVNLVPLVGHNAVRGAVMGHDYRREATEDEIEKMKTMVNRAVDDGVRGISNGLDYAPGAFASHEELVAVIGEVARRGGIFTSHWRRTGLRQGMGNPVLIKGLREALQIARDAKVPRVQISHVLNGYSVFPESPDELIREGARLTLRTLEEAIEEGLDVHWDVIPNTDGGTLSARFLASGLAPWLKMSGDLEGLARNLRAPDFREQVRAYIEAGKWYSLNPITSPGWASGIIIAAHEDSSLVERPLADIAEERGIDAL